MESMSTFCTIGNLGDGHFADVTVYDDINNDPDITYMIEEWNNPTKETNSEQDESLAEICSSSSKRENTKGKGPREPTSISEEETVDVHRFKFIVLLVLLWVILIVSPWVFAFTTKTEQSQFEQKFYSDSSKILDAVRISIENTLTPMDTMALALISHAKAQNDTWPFVTIPDYGARVAKALPWTDSIVMYVLPIVTPVDRRQWENYSRSHDSWVEESFAIQNKWDQYFGPKIISFDREPSEQISGKSGPIESYTRCVCSSRTID